MTTRRRTIARPPRIGFTLIELLFAIGIVALLIAIVTPAVMIAQRAAVRHRLAGDMVSISSALEAYKQVFGDYPQVTAPNTGFAVLGKALLGTYGDGFLPGSISPTPDDPNDPPTFVMGKIYMPGDCVQSGGAKYVAMVETALAVSDTTQWSPFDCNDLLDGFGTRLRAGGKKVGPFVQPEMFRVRGCAFLDSNDKPILYFPARHTKPNLSLPLQGGGPPFLNLNGYGTNAAGVQLNQSLFNGNDNLQFFMRIDDTSTADATIRMEVLLGDTSHDGMITGGEQAASTGPFLLWAPGPDGFYGPVTHPSTTIAGPVELGKCDDVTNFR